VACVTIAETKEVVVVVVTAFPPSARWRRTRRRELTLAGQFLVLQLVVVVLLLGIVGVISVRQSTTAFTIERGSQMRSVAEYVANLAVVRDQLTRAAVGAAVSGDTRRALAPSVDRALSLSGATDVLIAAPDGTVLASSDPSLMGTSATLGASDVTEGRGWTGDVTVDGDRAVAGHAPILGDDGTLIGLSLAEQTYPSVWDRLTGAASNLVLFLGLGALLGVVGTFAVSRVVKRRTRGLAPTEIAMLADHREALLHSIREGVVAVGTDRRVTMMNDAARLTLGISGDPVGRDVDELGLDPHVVDLITASGGDADAQDAVALVGSRVVVFNRRAASSHGEGIGSVTTMRDRTELVSLQNQLSSNLSITDTLRAQTHEFSNQLHTISGLVQLGEYDELRALVGTLTRRRAEILDFVTERVHDRPVAALLVAKSSVAAERGVRLDLTEDSGLPSLEPSDSADLTTLLGNLIDNAVDACSGGTDPAVTVSLQAGASFLHVEVGDNGPGVPEELREAIFVRGFSTKPEVLGGRGIGLPLVQLICTQRGGSIEVHQGDRTVFSVRLPYSSLERVP
jgi:sensor histidine kinase regulating citrate/malate metabolism